MERRFEVRLEELLDDAVLDVRISEGGKRPDSSSSQLLLASSSWDGNILRPRATGRRLAPRGRLSVPQFFTFQLAPAIGRWQAASLVVDAGSFNARIVG
jgi:hypothetical protein